MDGAPHLTSVLEPHAEREGPVEQLGRQRECDAHVARPDDGNGRHELAPAFGLERVDREPQARLVAHLAAHRREQRVARGGSEAAQLAAIVVVRLADATQRRESLAQRLDLIRVPGGHGRLHRHSTCDSSNTVLRGSTGSEARLRSMRTPGPG